MMMRYAAAIGGCATMLAHAMLHTPAIDSEAKHAVRFDPKLTAAVHRAVTAPLRAAVSEPDKPNPVAMSEPIVGIASVYNPAWPGKQEGGPETASGETYDPAIWTAAIQLELRGRFGGVRHGKNYRPAFALVENGERRVVVKINDVGPLMEGRVIDFNEQTMRYFDPTLQLGLIHGVKVTPLIGDDWPTGPVDGLS